MDRNKRDTARPDRFHQRLQTRRHILSPRMRMVADYIDQNRASVLSKSAIDLAHEAGVSDATVIRTVQALGFNGLVDLKQMLANHLGQSSTTVSKVATTIEQLQQDMGSVVDHVLQEHLHAQQTLAQPETRLAMERAVAILAQARRIGIFGIAASGILATYAARLFLRHGTPSYALNLTGIGLAEQLLEMSPGDALIVLLARNTHREIQATMEEANRLGIPVILITSHQPHSLGPMCAQIIILPRAKAESIPLHGPTLSCLEMLMLGLTMAAPQRSVESMKRLVLLRKMIRPGK
ncbi:MurR/RpiR family transcriptional regulator [Corticibacter populi]|uniref:MurR/RpiR family transcriptional regulator n=1 Tax=Corticibacter populi TaxID=1550736 RepID=A0A3M6QRI8_9BURK|nr:MurR/RpiR family transcriptional regulator [Corticibacter populi]RMX05665.1 MurR/RpiR family transcriptional regulator [Corticibacter populi]RZS31053.1 RpiR family transcriptional regulator [Corticibacter populi]